MIILSLILLALISINIIYNYTKNKNPDDYMQDMKKQLSEELKIIK